MIWSYVDTLLITIFADHYLETHLTFISVTVWSSTIVSCCNTDYSIALHDKSNWYTTDDTDHDKWYLSLQSFSVFCTSLYVTLSVFISSCVPGFLQFLLSLARSVSTLLLFLVFYVFRFNSSICVFPSSRDLLRLFFCRVLDILTS